MLCNDNPEHVGKIVRKMFEVKRHGGAVKMSEDPIANLVYFKTPVSDLGF